MIEPTVLFLSVLAVLNATLPAQDIPLDVDVRLVPSDSSSNNQEPLVMSSGSEAATAAADAPTPTNATSLDTITIGSLIALVAGGVAAFKKNAGKVDAVADSTVNLKESLKATDYGNKDTAQILSNALNKLSNVKSVEEIPQALAECAPAAKENAEAWKEDVKQYYENKPPVTDKDLGLDKTRQKLVQVNQETEKTPEP